MVKQGPKGEQVYPFKDELGWVWLDPSGAKTSPGPCFMCKETTERLDVDFMARFCDSAKCNKEIHDDIVRAERENPQAM